MKDPPHITAQSAYDYLVPLLNKFDATVQNISLPDELKNEWKEATEDLIAKAAQKPYKVAIVGRTGVGKSTLLNALLQRQVLTASASGACTAVTTEISYKNVKNIEAVVEFIAAEEWRKLLTRQLEEVNDTTVDTQEGPADNSTVSPAYQAREKVIGVYPHLQSVPPKNWKVEELLNDTTVKEYLGQTSVFSASQSSNFQKELEQFLASTLTSSDTRKLWPLVKIVKIMGRFDVLSTGVTLVDLPGHGDVDDVRDSMANEYLQSADAICLVAGIARAKDDRDIHSYLQKHLSQIIIDGRVQEKSISLILTGADSPIGNNEITLDPQQQAVVERLNQEALKLGLEITDLQAKKVKKDASKAKKKAEHIDKLIKQITEKRRQKENRLRDKNRLLALGRSKIVEKALHEKCIHIYRDISRIEDAVPDIPIFCLGSRDYLCLAQVVPDDSAIFLEQEETGIPRLRRYFTRDGERRNLTAAIESVTTFCHFLSRTTTFSSRPSGNAAAMIHELINRLETNCRNRLDELVTDITREYNGLLAVVENAVGEAERKSPEIFERHATKKWNQYRAMMRQGGQCENGNLNADLTKEILPAVQREWYNAVNTLIPLHLGNFSDNIETDLTATVKLICGKSQYTSLSLRKSLGLEAFQNGLKLANMEATKSAQRQGNRTWEPLMKNMLEPQYAKVAAEKGPGMFKRMKLSNKEYIHEAAPELFGHLNFTVRTLFNETVTNIEAHNRLEFMRLTKQMRQHLLGGEISPEMNAVDEAEKVVKAFSEEHEVPACNLLDELKERFQKVPLPLQ
ncbi:P-loop containing nucleoside triphosphate hydrolase protein [Mycena capillaripes]|nr:P-loop containing nucleoside triphosphate hydrolase protein [Mycena capillaripes]